MPSDDDGPSYAEEAEPETDDCPSYAEESESESDSDAEMKSKKEKGGFNPRVIEQFVHVESWVLSEHTQLGEDGVNKEIYEFVCCLITPSGLKKLPGHKNCEKDTAPWKHASTYEIKQCNGHSSTYSCPLSC